MCRSMRSESENRRLLVSANPCVDRETGANRSPEFLELKLADALDVQHFRNLQDASLLRSGYQSWRRGKRLSLFYGLPFLNDYQLVPVLGGLIQRAAAGSRNSAHVFESLHDSQEVVKISDCDSRY